MTFNSGPSGTPNPVFARGFDSAPHLPKAVLPRLNPRVAKQLLLPAPGPLTPGRVVMAIAVTGGVRLRRVGLVVVVVEMPDGG